MDPVSTSLREALERHLLEHGFPPDGGAGEKWGVVRIGPVPVCVPNIPARRRATAVHDLNHVLAGYGHDAVGEAEIGAWELGGGCGRYWVAWILNWSAMVLGLFTAPGRLLRAFARGRQSGNLYGADVDAALDEPVEAVRHALGLDGVHPVRPSDVALFAGAVCLAPVVGAIPAAVSTVTSPWWLSQGAHRQRRTAPAGG